MLNSLMISELAIIGIVVLVVVLLIAAWYVSTYNGLVGIENTVEEAFSTMDVQLKKRYDLIPNFVETVKGYAKHESETLEKVIAARNKAVNATGDDKIEAEKALGSSIRSVFALAESYPDLKANANFLDLQRQLQSIETEIASARRYYNGTVKEYNNRIQMFPSSIVANMKHMTKKAYFEVDDAVERKNVKVQF